MEYSNKKYTSAIAVNDLFMLFLIAIGGYLVANFATIATALLFGLELTELAGSINPEHRVPMLCMQIAYNATCFFLTALFFLKNFNKSKISISLTSKPEQKHIPLILFGLLITLMFFPAANYVGYLNSEIAFPDFLSTLESSLRSLHEKLKVQSEFLLDFDSTAQFLLGLFTMAIVPAIGEELFFRGLMQTYMFKAIKNHHVAIWATALLFGAFHLQFYGLFPRALLGALFGYLYIWSGSLSVAIAAHFIHNTFSLVMLYLFKLGVIEMNIDDTTDFKIFLFTGF